MKEPVKDVLVDCIIVTFHPDVPTLRKTIESIYAQVRTVNIIDNSTVPTDFGALTDLQNLRIKRLAKNIGIAAAQNMGISIAQKADAEFIMLSDQDTVYPANYVADMIPVFSLYANTAAVVPKFTDLNKNSPDGFITPHPWIFQRSFPTAGKHELFHAISSGKILKVSELQRIGLLDEDLFIDWVDLEWCWRARKSGYSVVGNADVEIVHQLGDRSIDLKYREINLRSPIRHYFITRNAFYLAVHSEALDRKHRIVLFFKSFRYVLGFPILARPRYQNLNAVLVGFYHGITGRLGNR